MAQGGTVSTGDILEDIRRKLKEANDRLKTDSGGTGVVGDFVNVSGQNNETPVSDEDDNNFDEIVLDESSKKTPDEEVQENLEKLRQNMQQGPLEAEFPDDDLLNDPPSSGSEPPLKGGPLEQQPSEATLKEVNKDPIPEDDETIHEQDIDDNAEYGINENDPNEKQNVNDLTGGEEFEDIDPEEEEEEDDQDIADSEQTPPTSVDDGGGELKDADIDIDDDEDVDDEDIDIEEEDEEEEDPASLALPGPRNLNPRGDLSEKIAELVDRKMQDLVKSGQYGAVAKSSTTLETFVSEALGPALEKWIDANQSLILGIVEKVTEKQISEAISKLKSN